jgi:predicted GNAT family acetyltransferase
MNEQTPAIAPVHDNPTLHRFEMDVEGHVAVAVYRKAPDVITFIHTEVPEALSGRGIGSKLIRGALEQVRSQGLKVVSRCPFVTAYLEKHPEFNDLLA